jgi:hypothetical protein
MYIMYYGINNYPHFLLPSISNKSKTETIKKITRGSTLLSSPLQLNARVYVLCFMYYIGYK